MPKRRHIVVDGSNVAYEETSKNGKPKIENLLAVRRELQEHGFEPIIIVDATFRHQVDDPKQLARLLDQQVVRQAPAETDADYVVLETADQLGAFVVANQT